MMRRWAPVLVLAVVVLGLLMGSVHQVSQVLRPRTAWEYKMLHADPVLYYALGSGPAPVFRLSGTEQVIRLVTHARTAATDEPYDPRRALDYGLLFELVDREGTPLWSKEIHTRTRQSKAELTDEGWLRENAFTLDGRHEIWDDRLLYLTLPPQVPVNAQLRVSRLGEADVLMRAYARRDRTPFQQQVFLLRGAASSRDDEGHGPGAGPLRLDQLTEDERVRLARYTWERMAADGEVGRDYRTTSVYYDGLRLPFDRAGTPMGFIVGPTEPAVVNVVGLGRARITLHDPRLDPELSAGPVAEALVVSARGGGGGEAMGRLELGAAGEVSTELPLADGVQSLVLEADAPVRVQVEALRSLPDAPLGRETPGPVEPDVQRIVCFGGGSPAIPVDIDVEPPEDTWDRLFRVSVRAVVAQGEDQGSTSVELVTLDEHGRELTRAPASITAPWAPFEHGVLADGSRALVTEPASIRVVVPPEAVVLRVEPGAGALVRVSMIDREVEPQVAPPYDVWGAPGWHWRYAPRLLDRWLPVLPRNTRALAVAQRRVVVGAQTRLEADEAGIEGPVVDASERPVTSKEPLGRPRQHLVITEVEPERRAEVLEQWKPGTFTRLAPGRPLALDLGRGPPRSPRIDWEVRGAPSASLGATLEILVDGEVVASRTIDATRGTVSLHELPRVPHTLELRTTAAVRAWIDRPPVKAGRAPLSRLRTVYALGREGLRVPVETRPGESMVLNVMLYAPGVGEDPEVVVRSTVDEGTPERRLGQAIHSFTPARRELPLPAAKEDAPAMFADVRGVSPGYARVVSIPIGDDIAPGNHVVHVTCNRPVWARFFVYDRAPTRSQSWVRSTMRSEP